MTSRKNSLVASLHEELRTVRGALDVKVASLDEHYKQIIELNMILDKQGFRSFGSLCGAEDCQSPPSGSLEELRDRVESAMSELKRMKDELDKAQQGQHKEAAVSLRLQEIILEAIHG